MSRTAVGLTIPIRTDIVIGSAPKQVEEMVSEHFSSSVLFTRMNSGTLGELNKILPVSRRRHAVGVKS